MSASQGLHPKVAFARLADPVADGAIEFHDGFYPALKAGSHTLAIKHEVTRPGDAEGADRQTVATYHDGRTVTIQGPQFVLPPGAVQSSWPPDSGRGMYDQDLPYVVLADPTLPWERSLVPGEDTGAGSLPWVALILVSADDITLPAHSTSPVVGGKVSDFIAPETGVLKPTFPTGWVSAADQSTAVQTVTLTVETFRKVVPGKGELALLSHVRVVNTAGEDPVVVACVLGNRLPRAAAAAIRYYAVLVSLEGFQDYLDGQPMPTGTTQVRLSALHAYTFVSNPEPSISFEQLVKGLIVDQTTHAAFSLPPVAGTLEPVAGRLVQGYVPTDFETGSGARSFAWYRGPFSPVLPVGLPPTGAAGAPVAAATNSDALMIYLADQGLFDLSYAAAWQLGRGLALADGAFAQAVWAIRRTARRTAVTVARLAAQPWRRDLPVEALAAPTTGYRRFARLMAEGLGEAWSDAMARARSAPSRTPAPAPVASPAVEWRSLLQHEAVRQAVAARMVHQTDLVTDWLAALQLLRPAPFIHMVPDARLAPAESLRFFHVDGGWLDALQAGALSLAIHDSADVAVQAAFIAGLRAGAAASARPVAGMLLRSQLVPGWPALSVVATAKGAPVNILRNECVAADIRLLLFDAVPDKVSLAEPYQGLRFGIEDNGVSVRDLMTQGSIGKPLDVLLPPSGKGVGFIARYSRDAVGAPGVLNVTMLSADLKSAARATDDLGGGSFAMELVKVPELQFFPTQSTGAAS